MYKLNPSFFLKRIVKAETPDELVKAQTGLWNLCRSRAEYIVSQYKNSFKILSEKFKF